ncbi:hypothetical protein ABZ611_16920 [Streptomyces sp. NPDC007861]|uniref:hypothetical protein n=1 Tax=Streptomyces sp. NPDC007861 TaxID=3154893 RepID=UPI0033ECDED6
MSLSVADIERAAVCGLPAPFPPELRATARRSAPPRGGSPVAYSRGEIGELPVRAH